MGKSLYITREAECLVDLYNVVNPLVSIHVNGPKIAEERIMDQLQLLGARSNEPLVVHFDIAPSVSFHHFSLLVLYLYYSQMVKAVDCFLFSVLVLGCFSDQRGKLWRRSHSHLYMIEMTEPLKKKSCSETQDILHFLPSAICQAPMTDEQAAREDCLDEKKWLSDSYQIVYYYLKNYNLKTGVSDTLKKFDVSRPIRHNTDFLQCIFRLSYNKTEIICACIDFSDNKLCYRFYCYNCLEFYW